MAKISKLALMLSLSIIFSLTSCGGESDNGNGEDVPRTETSANDVEVVQTPPETTVYRTKVDELRLREAPGTKARVMAKLPLRQELVSLDEASEETYTATLGGKRITDVWRKVKVTAAQGQPSLEGWVFGGGVEKVVISYETLPNGNLQRSFEDADHRTIANILGLDVASWCTFSGTIGYRKTMTGLYVPDGPFQIKGSRIVVEGGDPDKRYTEDYRGEFTDGKLDGAVTREVVGYEVYSMATIFFRNGRCEWGKMREEGEGMVSVANVPEMATCTFHYLADGLELQE